MQTVKLPVTLSTPRERHRLVEAAKALLVAAHSRRGLSRQLRELKEATEQVTGETVKTWMDR